MPAIGVLTLLLALGATAAERPPEWAQPVALEGAPNLHRITPLLYRSAQPSAAGMANLETLGIRTVIDLRAFHSDRTELAGTSLMAVDLDIKTWRIKDSDVVRVLRAVRRRENGPFLIHCQHGADRTGLMSAMFRLVEQGWTKEAALRELREGGYGYHPVWTNIVRYIETADVARLRRLVETPPEASPPAYAVDLVEERVTMPDGTRLAVTLYKPRGRPGERFPALLELLPYRKDDAFLARDYPLHMYFARRGYLSAKADVRGTGASQGAVPDREYSDAEIADAEALVAWLAARPDSAGKVGMWGISWGGFNALITAMRRPPALKAVLAAHASDDLYHDDVRYVDGLLHLDEYALSIDHDNALPRPPDYESGEAYFRDRFDRRPWLFTYLERQQDGPFWRAKSLRFDCASVRTPVYLIGGLLDSYRDAVPRLLACLKAPAKGELGPWTHDWPDDGEPGPNYEWRRQAVRWFDHWLKGAENGVMEEPRLVYFQRQGHAPSLDLKTLPGRWQAADWPLPGARRLTLHPAPGGRLAEAPSTGTARLDYRPEAGFAAGDYWGERTGDMAALDAQGLAFDTEPLAEDLEIAGFPAVSLRASVSAPLAHWAARLEDVAPDGSSALVTGAALNGAQRADRRAPAALDPGKPADFAFPLHFTTWRFARGHRVRLALTHSLFPMLWPLPEPVTSELALGGRTRLELPVAPRGLPPAELPEPEPREERPGTRDLSSRGWPYERVLSSGTGGGTVARWRGEHLYAVPGATVTGRQEMAYRVRPARPADAAWRGTAETTLELGARALRLETAAELKSDASEFRLTVTRRLWEDGRAVRERTFTEAVPRRFQ